MTVTLASGEKVPVTPEGYREHKFDVAKENRAIKAQEDRLKKYIAVIDGEKVQMTEGGYANWKYEQILLEDVDITVGSTYNPATGKFEGGTESSTKMTALQKANYEQREQQLLLNAASLHYQKDQDSVFEKKQEEVRRVKVLINKIKETSANYIAEPSPTDLQKAKYKPGLDEDAFSFQKGPASWLLPKGMEGYLEKGLDRNMKPFTDNAGKDFSDAANTQIASIHNLITNVKTNIDDARLGDEYDEVSSTYKASGIFDTMNSRIAQLVQDLKYQKFLSTPRVQIGTLPMHDIPDPKKGAATLDRIKIQLDELQKIQDLIKIEKDKIDASSLIEGGIQYNLQQAR